MTGHDQLIDLVLRRLRQYPPLADGQVFEESDIGILSEDVARAVVVGLDMSDATPAGVGALVPYDWASMLRISAIVRRDNRDVIDGRPTYALQSEIMARLVGEAQLGPDISMVELLRLQADSNPQDTRIAALHATYRFMHRTDSALQPV